MAKNDRHGHLDRARGYAVSIVVDEAPDAPFLAQAAECPYTSGVGDTPEQAVAVLTELLADTIEVLEGEGRPVPLPLSSHPAMLHLRVPKSLHQAVAQRAAVEGVSLNAAGAHLLAKGLAAEGMSLPKVARRRRSADVDRH